MTHPKPLLLLILTGVIAVSLLALVGCPAKKVETPAPPPTNVEPTPAPTAETPAATTGEFAWTETPAIASIPEGEIRGMINGKPFTAKTVRVKKDEGKAVLEISDAATEKPTETMSGDTGADLSFTLTEGSPGELVLAVADEKDFDKEHAYYHYPQGGDKGPMSINPEWGCALSITDWKLETSTEDPDMLGTVKGKVAIVFKDDPKSWVAGTFDCPYYKW